MNRDETKQEIKPRWQEILSVITEPAKIKHVNGKPSYICPICGHGKGGDGLCWNKGSKDGNGLKCFSCGFSGDIIDLYMKMNPDKSFIETVEKLGGMLGIETDNKRQATPIQPIKAKINRPEPPKQPVDYTAYYVECQERLKTSKEAIEYLEYKRNISKETALKMGIGYDPMWINPTAKCPPTKRLVIPFSKESYYVRAIDETQEYAKIFPKLNVGSPIFFNGDALYNIDYEAIFITEGATSSLAIMEANTRLHDINITAIGLNGIANRNKLVAKLVEQPTNTNLIICLDNDVSGEGATEKLKKDFDAAKIQYTVCKYRDCGDPNDALKEDEEAFFNDIKNAVYEARKAREAAKKPDNTATYIHNKLDFEISRFRKEIKTGFANLDEKADGLYSGLYVVAALASLGKTTFCHQIADQLAAAGNDVIFFSLEQSRLELVTKSLARITAQRNFADREEKAITSLVIRRGYNPPQLGDAKREYLEKVSNRLSIVEGNFDCNVSYIGKYVQRYIDRNGVRPVIFVDYLQIIQGEEYDRRSQTKEIIDGAVTALKRLSRDMDLTVFVISSINRQNYLMPIAFESLKESGAIEFTADVVWGLQLQVMNEEIFNNETKTAEKREKIRQAKTADPRKIELQCLKNRYGVSDYRCFFDYFPKFDLYVESSGNMSLAEAAQLYTDNRKY